MSRLCPRFSLPVRSLVCLLLIGATLASLDLLAPRAGSAAPRDAMDAAAQAGLVRLSIYFQQNLNNGCAPRPGQTNCVGSLTPDQNEGVRRAIQDVLPPGFMALDAFYVDSRGIRYGSNSVGSLSSMPFATAAGNDGVAGLQVRSTEGGTPGPFFTYTFASLRTILHPPNAAWLGPSPTPMPQSPRGAARRAAPASADQLTIWPLVLFTDTIHIGSVTPLLTFSSTYGPNMWAQLCYYGYTAGGVTCSGNDITSWIENGFDPSQGVSLWLEDMRDPARGQGQLVNYTSLPVGWDGTNADSTGSWMGTSTGNVSQQSCLAMQQAGDQHKRVLLPIADRSNNGTGSSAAYHIRNFAVVEVLHPTSADHCNGHPDFQGRYLGYTWRNTEATATGDLGAAYTNGQIVLPFAPPDPPAPPTATATVTDTPAATGTPTATTTVTATETATTTAIPTAPATATETATATAIPTVTTTAIATAVLPTATATPTLVPPTGTATVTAIPTATATVAQPTATATLTFAPPSATATATSAPATPTASPSHTAVPPSATVTASLSATPCVVQFSDVRPTDYFATPVTYLACHGVISGYSDGTFRPGNPTTRGQMVKIVVGGFGLAAPPATPPGGYTFADVPPAHPFYRYIEIAAARGIVSGYTCGGPGEGCDAYNRLYFRPGADVTRGQLSKIVVNAAGWPVVAPAAATFSDVPVGSPFYGYIETAACRGVVSGYADHTFRPAVGATRGQIAKIVYGALTLLPACGAR